MWPSCRHIPSTQIHFSKLKRLQPNGIIFRRIMRDCMSNDNIREEFVLWFLRPHQKIVFLWSITAAKLNLFEELWEATIHDILQRGYDLGAGRAPRELWEQKSLYIVNKNPTYVMYFDPNTILFKELMIFVCMNMLCLISWSNLFVLHIGLLLRVDEPSSSPARTAR